MTSTIDNVNGVDNWQRWWGQWPWWCQIDIVHDDKSTASMISHWVRWSMMSHQEHQWRQSDRKSRNPETRRPANAARAAGWRRHQRLLWACCPRSVRSTRKPTWFAIFYREAMTKLELQSAVLLVSVETTLTLFMPIKTITDSVHDVKNWHCQYDVNIQ